MKRKLNIVVVGRSGVGKSSFLNYAAGSDIFETGVGDPVTMKYFEQIDIDKPEQNVTYSLFDTKGLEQGKTGEWLNAINDEIDRRDKSDNIYDWLHTIIYCIDASAKRIQPFEVEAIKDLMRKGSVLVLFTKSDLVKQHDLDELKKQVLEDIGDKVQVLSVCSVVQRTRKGVSEQKGLEDVLRVSFLGLWEKMSKVLPNRIVEKISIVKAFHSKDELNKKSVYNYSFTGDHFKYKYVKLKKGYYTIDGEYHRLFDLPRYLDHNALDESDYRMKIHNMINDHCVLFNVVVNHFISNKKVFDDLGNDRKIIEEVMQFYNDVNHKSVKVLRDHKTHEAIEDIKKYDFEKHIKQYIKNAKKVFDALSEVDNCTFFSGDERRTANAHYSTFWNDLTDFLKTVASMLNNFKHCYEAELHAYGQYCLRSDELYDQQDTDEALVDLIELIDIALEDGFVSPKEKRMLRKAAQQMQLDEDMIPHLIEQRINYMREVYEKNQKN